jgi:hypothetical protein
MDDQLLRRIGMEDSESRYRLVGYFESVLHLARADIVSSFSEFIQCLIARVSDFEETHAVTRQLHSRLDTFKRDLDSSKTSLERLDIKARLAEKRSDELGAINQKMHEAIEVYRSKRTESKQALAERDQAIHSLRSEMNEYDIRLAKCLADVSAADTTHATRLKDAEIKSARSDQLQRRLVRRVKFFRRETRKFKGYWATWSKQSYRLGQQRCGCPASIRYFERNNIDLEYVAAEATRVHDGFQNELKETTDSMRAQLQAVCVERDDVLADCALYIDRLLCAEDELRKSGLGFAALMSEFSVVKAELVRRSGVERSLLRAQLFAVGGRELVCPVPTVDGEFVSLADVYRGWMDDGRGEGIGLQFKSPFTGESCYSP